MRKSTKTKIIYFIMALILVFLVAILISGFILYRNRYRFWSWSDAHPSEKQIKMWTVKDFNPADYQIWNVNPEFDDIEFDTELIKDSTALVKRADKDGGWYIRKLIRDKKGDILAPKEGGWGIMGYGWKQWGTNEYTVDAVHLQSQKGIYKIYIKATGQWTFGNGTTIQGWIWDTPENTPWHSPFPILVTNKKMVLSFKVKINKAHNYEKIDHVWQMMSVSTFLTSPELEKLLVIDLAFYINQNVMYSLVSTNAYHYQRMITQDKKDAFGKWKTYTVDYSWFVADALKRFHLEYAADTLQIESLEILSETMYGECEFEVDNLYLYYRSRKNAAPPTSSTNNAK